MRPGVQRTKRRKIGRWPDSADSPEDLAERVEYVGSPEHKDHPSPAGSPQRAARAFAAELLAPAAALERRVSGWVNDHDVEQLADEFLVSPQVICHQVENHGLGYVQA